MRVRAGAIVGCLVLVLTATPAVAKKKAKKKGLGPVVTVAAAGNSTSAAGEISTATATCPAGTVAMGGGFTAPVSPDTLIAVDNSFRSGIGSWTASGRNAVGAAFVTAYAYCRRSPKPVIDVTATGVIPSGAFMNGTAAATCPVGTQLIGGGFQTTPDSGGDQITFPQVNSATAPGIWTVRTANNGTGTHTLTAHAYCLGGIKPPLILSASTAPTVTAATPVSVTTPACPVAKKKKGKKTAASAKKKRRKPVRRLSAGGFSSRTAVMGSPTAIFAESRIAGGGWMATAINTGGITGSLPVTSQGICV